MTLRGNRKFLIAAGAIVLSFVLACFKLLVPEFVTVVTVALAAFHGAHAIADWRGNATPPK